eukprot:14991862-Alexandrium_andersonii.AAC.1
MTSCSSHQCWNLASNAGSAVSLRFQVSMSPGLPRSPNRCTCPLSCFAPHCPFPGSALPHGAGEAG